MDIKENIGNRITLSRKALGMTIKELAERTGTLSAARISNWEQGTRSPGPTEAMILAKVLDVAASYLLCISDDPRGDLHFQENSQSQHVPLVALNEANITKNKLHRLLKKAKTFSEDINTIYLNNKQDKKTGNNLLATFIEDKSMSPDFMPNDIVIIDFDRKPKPGNYVLAYDKIANTNVIRKYKQTTTSKKNHFELVALNPDWGTIEMKSAKDGYIIATVIEHRRYYS